MTSMAFVSAFHYGLSTSSSPLRASPRRRTRRPLCAPKFCMASSPPAKSSPPASFSSRLRRLLAAATIPLIPILPLNDARGFPQRPIPTTELTTTVTTSTHQFSSRHPAVSVRLATVAQPVVPQPARNAALHALIPNALDSRLRIALKCLLLAGIMTSVITAVIIAVFWIIQDSLVYKPTKVWRGSPKSSGMPHYDDVSYTTPDGVDISGWFIRQPGEDYVNARTMIYFHGTDKNASFRLKKVVGFYETCKCNVLLLSYRGYGLSSGHPNERGLRLDAESALHYLASRRDIDVSPNSSKLWVYGESLGGAVALHFTDKFQERINALILENTFTSLLDMIKLEFPILGVFRYLSRNRWVSKRRIKGIRTPILFLSGLRDSYIPPTMMRQMHELAGSSKLREFVEFENGTHNRTWTMDGFYASVASFMERVERDLGTESPVDPQNFHGDDSKFVAATA